jgi:NAD(P)-dependent dehydrogenase (short-subunit alcohol dehydrogenase family)
VLFSYARDEEAAAATLADAPGAGAIRQDLRAGDAPETLVAATVRQLGGIDVLINCAGIYPHYDFLDTEREQLEDILSVNFTAAFRLMQHSARAMTDNGGGAIVNITSINAFAPEGGLSAYDASKAALTQATRTAAVELGRLGIRVNAVAPGLVDAPDLDEVVPERVKAFLAHAPLGKLVRAEDVARAALFLATAGSAAITGQTLVVDAGVSLAGYMSEVN